MLNPTAGIVKVDTAEDKVGSLFIHEKDKKEPDTGLVVEGPIELVGKKVRFREHFGERIILNDEPHLWFSELALSLYYAIYED